MFRYSLIQRLSSLREMLFLILSAEPQISESYTEIYNLIFFSHFVMPQKVL